VITHTSGILDLDLEDNNSLIRQPQPRGIVKRSMPLFSEAEPGKVNDMDGVF
jgi:hypothetical protein